MPADPTGILGYEPAEICWSTHLSWALFVAGGFLADPASCLSPSPSCRTADLASCLSSSPSCRFLRTRPAVCLIGCSISVSHRFTVVFFLADPAVSSVGQLGLSVRGVGLLALCAGLFVVWGCWISLYWSTGGVGLLDLSTGLLVVWGCWFSLLVYWWCGAAGSLYWSTGGVGVTVYWWSRSADLIDSL